MDSTFKKEIITGLFMITAAAMTAGLVAEKMNNDRKAATRLAGFSLATGLVGAAFKFVKKTDENTL